MKIINVTKKKVKPSSILNTIDKSVNVWTFWVGEEIPSRHSPYYATQSVRGFEKEK